MSRAYPEQRGLYRPTEVVNYFGMKLKDIFPRWLFRERSYGELELGGGSAFAHLTEDVQRSQLVSDWGLALDPGSGTGFGASTDGSFQSFIAAADIGSFNYPVYRIEVESESRDRFRLMPDGSLHWGDGSAAPDVSLSRSDGGLDTNRGLRIGSQLSGQPLLQVQPGELDFWRDYYDDGNAVLEIHGGDGSMHWSDGTNLPDTHLHRSGKETLVLGESDYEGSLWLQAAAAGASTVPSVVFFLQTGDHGNATDPVMQLFPDGGSGQTTFEIASDGSLRWGDGTAVPDVSLARGGPHRLDLLGRLQVHEAADNDNLVSLANGVAYFQAVGAGDPDSETIAIWDDSGNGSHARFAVGSDGSLHWGDGTNAPDVSMKRNIDGSLGFALTDGNGAFFSEDGTNASTFTRLDPNQIQLSDGSSDVVMTMIANHVLKLWGNGSGLQLSAPDGTAYNITVTNAGAVIATAA